MDNLSEGQRFFKYNDIFWKILWVDFTNYVKSHDMWNDFEMEKIKKIIVLKFNNSISKENC